MNMILASMVVGLILMVLVYQVNITGVFKDESFLSGLEAFAVVFGAMALGMVIGKAI